MTYTTHGLMTPADMAEYRREYDLDDPGEPTMGTGNVHDDDAETLQFADESEYGESDDDDVDGYEERDDDGELVRRSAPAYDIDGYW